VRIREEQLAALSGDAGDDYASRVLVHLRTLYPEFYYRRDEVKLREFVRESVSRADGYGLRDEFAVIRYIDYRVLLGMEFDALPEYVWIKRILSDGGRSELQRIKDVDRNMFGGALEEPDGE
jgi:hypothetical protein